ncbi:cyclic GMP-AMP synthase-like [Pholidichthys leucotaenia]
MDKKQPEIMEPSKVDALLRSTLEKMKIKKKEQKPAAKVINEIKKTYFRYNIIKHLKENTECFKEVGDPLPTGSYYENIMISHPDEFDIMVPMQVERVKTEMRKDSTFYSVDLKRGQNPLKNFKHYGVLFASEMLNAFREEVKKCIKKFAEWKVMEKKPGSPAVTLTTETESVSVSLDVVLCLMVKSSWPSETNEGLQLKSRLGSKVRQEYRQKPYYLVPKYEGRGNMGNAGVLAKGKSAYQQKKKMLKGDMC